MSYQYMHAMTYSLKSKPTKENERQYNSAEQVLGEALRQERYSRHVEASEVPLAVTGTMSLHELHQTWKSRIANAQETVTKKDGTTYQRRLKNDRDTLYTEIHSHPMTVAELRADQSGAAKTKIKKWINLAVRDFQRRMPTGIDYAVVMHLDEPYVHFHILAINTPDPKLNANKIHAGKTAASKIRNSHAATQATTPLPHPEPEAIPKKPKRPKPSKNRVTQKKNDEKYAAQVAAWDTACAVVKASNQAAVAHWTSLNRSHVLEVRRARGVTKEVEAYVAAMRSLQDSYYEHVGKPCGLLRDGPRKARRTTLQHAEAKRQAQLLERGIEQVFQERKRNKITDVANAAYTRDLEGKRGHLEEDEENLKRATAQLKKREQALEEKTVRLQVWERSIAAAQAELVDGFQAMEAVLTSLEDGTGSIHNGRLRLSVVPSGIKAAFEDAAPKGAVSSLLRRFVTIVAKALTAVEGRRRANPEPSDHQTPNPW